MVKPDYEVVGHGVELWPIDETDVRLTLRLRNLARDAFFDSGELTLSAHLRWLADYFERDSDIIWMIKSSSFDHGVFIGQCSVYDIDPSRNEAQFGRLIVDPTDRGEGYATSAVRTAVHWAFSAMNLSRVYLRCKHHNFAALAVYRKCGFIETKNENGVIEMEARRSA